MLTVDQPQFRFKCIFAVYEMDSKLYHIDEKKKFKIFKAHGFVDRYNEKHGNIIKQYAIQDCLDLVMPGSDICYAEQSRIVNSYDDINKHVLAKPFEINSNIKTKIKFQNDTYFAISPHLGEHVITEN